MKLLHRAPHSHDVMPFANGKPAHNSALWAPTNARLHRTRRRSAANRCFVIPKPLTLHHIGSPSTIIDQYLPTSQILIVQTIASISETMGVCLFRPIKTSVTTRFRLTPQASTDRRYNSVSPGLSLVPIHAVSHNSPQHAAKQRTLKSLTLDKPPQYLRPRHVRRCFISHLPSSSMPCEKNPNES